MPENTNGKMSLKVYINQILEPVVKPWLLEKQDFALEEDGDSGHCKANIVRQWKEENNMEYFFNCASSPDISPIENCWQPPKPHLKKSPHWDPQPKSWFLRGGIWFRSILLTKSTDLCLERLRDVITSDGDMVGY